ncbi:MAG: hypothetical protein IPM37_23210 [Hahellaceae bacterium]|nr:hypothetical protein [Hahellaceae bacterium]
MNAENRIKSAVEMIGGVTVAATLCGVTRRSVYKWIERGRLPKSAYTGEKDYAEKLARHPGARFTANWLIERTTQKAA